MNEKIFNEMNTIKELLMSGNKLHVFGTKEEPLFLAVEVAKMIDYSNGNTYHMLDNLDSEDKQLINVSTHNNSTSARGNGCDKWFINENGLYEVLMRSTKPLAKVFKRSIKAILHTLRTEHEEETGEDFFPLGGYIERWESWTALRDDMGYPTVSFRKFMETIEGADIEKEVALYEEMRVSHEKI